MDALEPLGVVDSEFACVKLSIDRSGQWARLRIEDMSSDRGRLVTRSSWRRCVGLDEHCASC